MLYGHESVTLKFCFDGGLTLETSAINQNTSPSVPVFNFEAAVLPFTCLLAVSFTLETINSLLLFAFFVTFQLKLFSNVRFTIIFFYPKPLAFSH